MADLRYLGDTSNRVRFIVTKSSDGKGFTGLAYNTSNLVISTICDNEATVTRYRASSSEIETISTLGTFATPTSGKCRFKEVDATNHPGLYEIQFADARFAVSGSKRMVITISGNVTDMRESNYEIDLKGVRLTAEGLKSILVESDLDARQALSIILAACGGVLSGAATTNVLIQAANHSGTNRIDATVDADGNRSALTLTPS